MKRKNFYNKVEMATEVAGNLMETLLFKLLLVAAFLINGVPLTLTLTGWVNIPDPIGWTVAIVGGLIDIFLLAVLLTALFGCIYINHVDVDED